MTRGRALGPGRLWKRGHSWLLDYRAADGKRHHRTLSSDRRTAEAIRARLIHQRDLQRFGLLDLAGQDRPLSEIAKSYLADLRRRVVERHYDIVSSQLGRTLGKLGPVTVGELRAMDVARVRDEIATELGLSNRTANLITDSLRACLSWAVDAELIDKNPLARLKRLRDTAEHARRHRRALSEDEIARFLAAADEDDAACAPMHMLEHRVRVPQRIFFQTLLETGMRYGEARQLRWGDVDLGQRLLVLRAESTKSRKQRVIPVRVAMADELRALRVLHDRALGRLPSASDCVFLAPDGVPHKRPTTNAMRVFHRMLVRARIPRVDIEGRSIDIHGLRHTCATRFARAGAPMSTVQRLLGHADIRTTSAIYVHVDLGDLWKAVESVPLADQDRTTAFAAR